MNRTKIESVKPTGLQTSKPEMPTDFLRQLISIGQSENFDALQQLFTDYPEPKVGHLMRQPFQFWYPIVDTLSDAEAVALAKALTVAERDYPWFNGGSVSGSIWVFRRLQNRTPRQMDELADWILRRTNNGWSPFGGSNYGATSLAKYRELEQRAFAGKAARQQAEIDRHTTAMKRKAEEATVRLFGGIRRNDTKGIRALLVRGAKIDQPNSSGQTALAFAESLGNQTTIDLLTSHQPNLSAASGQP